MHTLPQAVIITSGALVAFLAIRHDGGNEVRARSKGIANNITAHGVQHAHRPQGTMGESGVNVTRVGGGLNAIHHNVTVHRVGIVETISPHVGDTHDLITLASGGGQRITSLDNAGNSQLVVDIEVVVASQHDGATASSGQANKLGTNSSQLVREHVHVAVLTRRGQNLPMLATESENSPTLSPTVRVSMRLTEPFCSWTVALEGKHVEDDDDEVGIGEQEKEPDEKPDAWQAERQAAMLPL
jgi:hypothetical protein